MNEDQRTPYTSTTGFYPRRSIYNRQKSKTTQHNFLSENLSISDIYETGENEMANCEINEKVQNG